jgi:hypothetical protein
MPSQDCVRGDQTGATQCSGQPPDKGGEDRSVRPVQARFRVGAAEDGDLMAQHEELDVLGGGRATQEQDQPEHLSEDQIRQPQRHGGDRARASERADHRRRGVCDVLEPRRFRARVSDDASRACRLVDRRRVADVGI